ncbi:hypothetical protein F8388_019906 [Cannabis sativa]|uniref:Reverse transcriptase zinc-binding domain-containing protein n=1 Tax=Cannabis sativa TaxID=3483 RepID=A0A7J6H5U3_CANSA|nr:hypothetical protein G4B88_011720 [Cannabis sativa]KAF4390251.1 hypothetical protein F8388_019906 [Cannabis sativa]
MLREITAQSDSSQVEGWWKTLWKTKVPPKFKHFVWKAYHSWLPTNSNLAKRGVKVDSNCTRCGSGQLEDVGHVLWGCKLSIEVWQRCGWWEHI